MITSFLLFILGLLMVAGSVLTVRRNKRLSQEGLTADGTIVDVKVVTSTDQNDNDTVSYYPVFQFSTADGRVVRVESKVSGGQSTYQVGQTVPVVYREAEPQKAKINRKGELYTGPIFLGCCGGVAMIAGIVMAVVRHGG